MEKKKKKKSDQDRAYSRRRKGSEKTVVYLGNPLIPDLQYGVTSGQSREGFLKGSRNGGLS